MGAGGKRCPKEKKMGLAKRMLEQQQAAHDIGIEIGVRAGVLERCEAHGCYWVTGGDKEEAYQLATSLFRYGDALVAGLDMQDIVDGINDAVAEAGIDGCAHCASIMADD